MASLYPCHCEEKVCICAPGKRASKMIGSRTDNSNLLKDKLQIAAEFWMKTSNIEKHWATKWGSGRVAKFIETVTGSVGDTPQIGGRQFLRMAVNALINPDTISEVGGGEKELRALIPLTVHRRKITRLLMQRKAPEYDFVELETPRKERERALPLRTGKPAPENSKKSSKSFRRLSESKDDSVDSARMETSSDILEQMELEERILEGGIFPVLSVSGPKSLLPGRVQKLDVKVSTTHFLVDAMKHEREIKYGKVNAGPGPTPASLTHESCALRAGAEIVVVPRFSNAAGQITVNPERQSFRWLREQHNTSFDIEWSGKPNENLSVNEIHGTVEFWVGPVLVGKQRVSLSEGVIDSNGNINTLLNDPAQELEAAQDRWEKHGCLFRSVIMLYSPNDRHLQYALVRAEKALQGCVHLFHCHKQGTNMNYFLTSSAEFNVTSIQLCLSKASEDCRSFRVCAELLVKSFEIERNSLTKNKKVPDITAMYWSHPKPDLQGHPVLSQILHRIQIMEYYNAWLIDLPVSISGDGFGTGELTEHKIYVPGAPVAFRAEGSIRWLRGRIAGSGSSSNFYHVVADGTGELMRNINVSDIKALSKDSSLALGNAETKNGNKNSHKHILTASGVNIGDQVYSRKQDGTEYHPGIIVAVHRASNTVDIAFENGDAEAHVDIRSVRLFEDQYMSRQRSHAPKSSANNLESETSFRSQNTGAFKHGALVHVSTKEGQKFVGRIRRALEYGLKYDVMLCNGELLQSVPVHIISSADSKEKQTSIDDSRTYVDAMCDRLREVLTRAAKARPDGRDLRYQFDSMDENQDGLLTARDFKITLHRLGFRPKETEVLEFMDRISEKRNGSVTYSEFVRFALPRGVLQKEKHLKKSISFYEAALSTLGIIDDISTALRSHVGKLWEELVEADGANTGILEALKFKQCLIRCGIDLSIEQYAHLSRIFAHDGAGMIHYREFASVMEILLSKVLENNTSGQSLQRLLNQSTDGSSPKFSDAEEETKMSETTKKKHYRLKLEHASAIRIQKLVRARAAKKSASSRLRVRQRWGKKLEQMDSIGTSASKLVTAKNPNQWWIVSNSSSENEPIQGHGERKIVIDKWHKLLLLNTKNGSDLGPAFRSMDTNCDGAISIQELWSTMNKHGFDNRHASLLFREMDINSDGEIDFLDFKLFVLGKRKGSALESRDGASTRQLMIEDLGKELCGKLRRYYVILKRCGTDILDLLLYRPKSQTICAILKRQGFNLSTTEWKRLEVHLATLVEHRGDRLVCEDLFGILSATEQELEHEAYAAEEKHVREYLQKGAANTDLLGSLGKTCHKIVQGLKMLCQTTTRKSDKHNILWWLLSINDDDSQLTMDKLDVEILLSGLKLRYSGAELQQLIQALDPKEGRFDCKHFAKLIGLNRKVQEFLETDFRASRHSKNFILNQRMSFVDDENESGNIKLSDPVSQLRQQGTNAVVKWLHKNLGKACYKRLRSSLIASQERGNQVTDGGWLSERYHARLGYIDCKSFERALDELRITLTPSEKGNLLRLIVPAGTDRVDVLNFADFAHAVIVANVFFAYSSRNVSEKEEAAQRDAEAYLRSVLHKYIKQPRGHRNLIRVFESFDSQSNGTIDKNELSLVFKGLNVDVGKVDISPLVDKFDLNGDGQLDYVEFLDALGVRKYGSSTATKNSAAAEDGGDSMSAKLRPHTKKVGLCKEDIEDACAKASASGFLSRRDIEKVFSALDLAGVLKDNDIEKLLRYSRTQLQNCLLESIGSKPLAPSQQNTKNSSNVKSSSSVNLTTPVILLFDPFKGSQAKVVGSKNDKYDVRASSGKMFKQIPRSHFRISAGSPFLKQGDLIVNKTTREKGIVTKTYANDAKKIDVRVNKNALACVSASQYVPANVGKTTFALGQRVECFMQSDYYYYPAKIVSVSKASYSVEFAHGERLDNVPSAYIRVR